MHRLTNCSPSAQLATSRAHLDEVIAETRELANTHLHTAQELSLLRHSLADELTALVDGLVSSMSAPDSRPTLLEDLETMHRNLKEQESVKSYVQIIYRGLVLRCVPIWNRTHQHGRAISLSNMLLKWTMYLVKLR
jgi:hypothetical protein